MTYLLTKTRAAYGPEERDARTPFPAPSEEAHGLFRKLVSARRDVLQGGDIVLGFVVHMDPSLQGPNGGLYEGHVLHPRDPSVTVHIPELERAAGALRGLRAESAGEPALAKLVGFEKRRYASEPLSPYITRGRPIVLSTVAIYPRELPTETLEAPFLPVLVHPDSPHIAVLPSKFWAEDLRAAWLDFGATMS